MSSDGTGCVLIVTPFTLPAFLPMATTSCLWLTNLLIAMLLYLPGFSDAPNTNVLFFIPSKPYPGQLLIIKIMPKPLF